MKINLINEINKEVDFFVEKFKGIGWKQEDLEYLTKDTGFLTNPTSRNEQWKTTIGIVLFPKLLTYTDKDDGNVCKVWIRIRVSIDENKDIKYQMDCPRLRQVSDFLKEEIEKIGFKPFYDEDSYNNNFTRPKVSENTESVSIECYVNKDYPEGRWENHTL